MDDITALSATQIAAAIREKRLSCAEVMEAHLERIEDVNGPLNAVVRVLATPAREEARAADDELARGDARGPLHGVPMTIKDAWEVAGVPSTGGTLGRADYVPSRDAPVIARMRAAGAIPIGMTNLPELSMAFESDNLVHGRTQNPYDAARTPGGSGGGGAAAIAAAMSPLEIGADTGGSIRLPSHFCGIAGLKATTGRVPLTGYFPPLLGILRQITGAGPMARTVADLAAALPLISGSDGVDPHVHDMPLRSHRQVATKGMRVAFHTHNGVMPARADVAYVVRSAAKALSDAGAIVEEKRPAGVEQCLDLFSGLLTADGGYGFRRVLEMAGTKRWHALIEAMFAMAREPRSAAELGDMLVQLDMYRAAMLAFFRDYDLILSPVNALPAIPHGTSFNEDTLPAFSYTIAHNLTGWPSAVVRCGTSTEGLPIGVQAIAKPWREHVALAAAEHLETALGGYRRPALGASA